MVLAKSILPRTTREALKTALAMTLTYAIALQAGWDKPLWAGFAVAVVSQSTLGLSLNKGGLRMLGTLAAALVALILIGLFPQQRWFFMLALSLWVGICTYMMLGSGRAYFWNVCGFVSVIICVSAAMSSLSAFDVAILRAQETGLGVLVYSLVAMLVWPSHSREQFLSACETLSSNQLEVYQQCRQAIRGGDLPKQLTQLRSDMIGAQSALPALLEAAISDSYDIWENRRQWREYLTRAVALSSALEQLSENLPAVRGLPLGRLLPNFELFSAELEQQLAGVGHLQEGRELQVADVTELVVKEAALRELSLFDAGSFTLLRHQLTDLASQVRTLLASLNTALSGEQAGPAGAVGAAQLERWMPDPDRVAGASRIMLTLWIAYLAYIFVEGLPGGATFVMLTGSLAMGLAGLPTLAPKRVLVPAMLSILLAGLIYIFVMPRLTDFHELGLLIFGVTFAVCKLFASPEKLAVRTILLSVFVTVTSIDNQQSYSFLSVANLALLFSLILLLLQLASHFPFSPRPERVVQRLLRSFFRSSAFLLSGLPLTDSADTKFGSGRWLHNWRLRYHCHLLATLPCRLTVWSKLVDKRYLPGESAHDLELLVSTADTLGFQLRALVKESGYRSDKSDSADPAAIGEWRKTIRAALLQLADELSGAGTGAFDNGLPGQIRQATPVTLESALRAVSTEGRASVTGEVERVLRLLGMTRGVGDSLLVLIRAARRIEWPLWQEARFY